MARAVATSDSLSGRRALFLENESLRLVIQERGSDVSELIYKPLGVDLMWHSPLRSFPAGGQALPDSNLEDSYCGGWQDLLPSIGPGPAELHGARFGQHGETGLLSWKMRVEEHEDSAKAVLSAEGVRYPYLIEKMVTVGEGAAAFEIEETLTNRSSQELEFYWLQHPAFGEPFLAPGCRLELPDGCRGKSLKEFSARGRVAEGDFDWPVAPSRGGGTVDLCRIPAKSVRAEETTFVRVTQGWYTFSNPELGLRIRFQWDESVFKWIWFWQNYGVPDYPYFGTAWNVGVELATSLPTMMGEQAENDAISLGGGKSVTTRIHVSLDEAQRR